MDPIINGMNVAILVTDGFEQNELSEPQKTLEAEGALVRLVSDRPEPIRAWHQGQPGDAFPVDLLLQEADALAFDAVLLPGGAQNAAALCTLDAAQRFVQDMAREGKPIAALCHGARLLVAADLVRGRTLTSSPDLAADIRQAGGHWVDQEVVRDDKLVSSCSAADLPAFNAAMVAAIAARRQASVRGTPDENAVGIASS